ncbi:MAG: DUF2505 family protein [Deltaproteobacteria bacterium]|nr:DUF2505 family protein [Deltaproteobacteria bacterium]
MKLHVDQRFARVTRERFVATYFAEDFNDAVAAISGLKSRKLVEEHIEPDGTRVRRVRMQPSARIPPPIDRVIGSATVAWDEVQRYHPSEHLLHFHVESRAAERVRMAGVIRFLEDGDGVRRVIDAELTITAPLGLGALIERFVIAETDRGYRRMGEFLQRWLDEHGPASS